ncbi:MAG TPA: serine hydrolase domain-containing protein [Caulobacteraceae bacterium]|jgi:CubicO group peptidase (beta-lactamase class C family)|nr:serine hydrolase domain-containing protein [Caulobacteraceae bacterium]
MRSVVVTAVLVAVLSVPAVNAATPAAAPCTLDPAKIDAVFSDFGPTTPGCALGIYSDGQVLYAKGYGMADLDLNVPITPRTMFDIGSTSKQFTAAAIVMLADEGKLKLTDDIRKYLPEIPDYGHLITIDNLLHHTSGLRDYDGLLYLAGHYFEDFTDDDDALAIIARQKALNFTPGTQWSYSNTGFFLQAIIVKRVTGESLADFDKTNFFQPLGMTETNFRTDHTAILKDRATGYDPKDGGGFKIDLSNWDQIGDGGVNTNVLELAKWDADFYDGKVGGRQLIDQMQTRATLDNGKPTNYGRGLFLDTYRGLTRVQHGGSWAGYRAMLMRFPEQKLSIGMTCNVSNADTMGRAEKVADVVLAKAFTQPRASTDAKGAPAPYTGPKLAPETVAGAYVSDAAQSALRLVADKGVLVLKYGPLSLPMDQTGPRQFTTKAFPVTATFDPDDRTLVLVIGDDAQPPYTRVAPWSPSPADIDALAGRYHSPELGTDWTIRVADGVAYVKGRAVGEAKLDPIAKDIWTSDMGYFAVRRGADGHITGYDLSASRMLRIGFNRVN